MVLYLKYNIVLKFAQLGNFLILFSSFVQEFASLRVYSKSCSLEPPPGFSILPQVQLSSTGIPVTKSAALSPSVSHSNISTSPILHANVESSISEDMNSARQTPGISSQPLPTCKWFYIDSVGKIQGPFGNLQMSGWMAAGFLPLGIELRRDCDECFLTLG